MTKLETLQFETQKAISSLYSHPALREDLFQNLNFSINRVCKRGYEEHCKKHMQLTIFHLEKDIYNKFEKEFEKRIDELRKESKDDKDFELHKDFISIYKTYKQVFNEEWKFDHIEFWAEINFSVFVGDFKKKNSWMDYKNWQSFQGIGVDARTFEEMVIKIVSKFKKTFGDFEHDDFLTKKEKENHKKQDRFLHKKLKDGYVRLDHNPKYITVDDGETNRRWLQWFAKTDYAKENWKESFDEILKGRNEL